MMCVRIVILILAICGRTLEHIVDDADACSLARACAHDGAEARGIDADGRTVRLFLDACDLHEYNCDQGTNFKLVTPCSSTTTETEASPIDSTVGDSKDDEDYKADYKNLDNNADHV